MPVKQIVPSADQYGATKTHGNKVFRKAYFASGFTQYLPYVIDYDGSANQPVGIAPAALAVYQEIGVPQDATTTTAGWYWVQVAGPCTAYVDGTASAAAGSFIELTANTRTFMFDHGTARSTNSVGTIDATCATAATTNACEVFLIGQRVIVAAN
jgi:hypothetical protein